jgi:SAM-dependent methyltransferase
VNAAFETWRPPPGAAFAAVVAATSWHWADPELRYRRAWELLRPEGHLAFWAAVHVLPVTGDPIFLELQDVYEEIGAGRAASWPRPRELHAAVAARAALRRGPPALAERPDGLLRRHWGAALHVARRVDDP